MVVVRVEYPWRMRVDLEQSVGPHSDKQIRLTFNSSRSDLEDIAALLDMECAIALHKRLGQFINYGTSAERRRKVRARV